MAYRYNIVFISLVHICLSVCICPLRRIKMLIYAWWVIEKNRSSTVGVCQQGGDRQDTILMFISLPNIDRTSKFFHYYTHWEIRNKNVTKHFTESLSPNLNCFVTLVYLMIYQFLKTCVPCLLGRCLAEMWTCQRPDVWQAAVMTKPSHSNRFYRRWRMSSRCSTTSTGRCSDWLNVVRVLRRFASTSLFFGAADRPVYNQSSVNFSL